MDKLIIYLTMVYMHILDDFVLQSTCLVNLKQRDYWKNDPVGKNTLYNDDYKMALFIHSFSWSFSIFIPVFISYLFFDYEINIDITLLLFFINIIIHMIVDNLKANKKKINLMVDQTIHLIQIGISFNILLYLK